MKLSYKIVKKLDKHLVELSDYGTVLAREELSCRSQAPNEAKEHFKTFCIDQCKKTMTDCYVRLDKFFEGTSYSWAQWDMRQHYPQNTPKQQSKIFKALKEGLNIRFPMKEPTRQQRAKNTGRAIELGFTTKDSKNAKTILAYCDTGLEAYYTLKIKTL